MAQQKLTVEYLNEKYPGVPEILGEVPDRIVAARFGVSMPTVRQWRRALALPAPARDPGAQPTEPAAGTDAATRLEEARARAEERFPGIEAHLGAEPDDVVAARYGTTKQIIASVRGRLGAPPFSRRHDLQPDEHGGPEYRALERSQTIREAAEHCGLTGTTLLRRAVHYAERHGLEVRRPEARREQEAERWYRLRCQGMTWRQVAESSGAEGDAKVAQAARRWALRHGETWPAGESAPSREGGKKARAPRRRPERAAPDPQITIDVEAETVLLGEHELSGQWVELYAALALLDGADDVYLGAGTLRQLQSWRSKEQLSAGKEVARHLSRLESWGIGDVLRHRGRTKAWRLALAADRVRLLPSRAVVRAWLLARRTEEAVEVASSELVRFVQAEIDLLGGRAELVGSLPSAGGGATGEALDGWAAILAGRAMRATGYGAGLDRAATQWRGRKDLLGRAVGTRLETLAAAVRLADAPDKRVDALRTVAARVERGGDVGTLGVVLAALGRAARASGDPESAVDHLARAVALLGIAGDLSAVGSALLALAASRVDVLALQGEVPDRLVFEVVDTCLLTCQKAAARRVLLEAHLDSAGWAVRSGQVARARRHLQEAERLIAADPKPLDLERSRHERVRLDCEQL